MKSANIQAVHAVAASPSQPSFFSKLFNPITQRNRMKRCIQVSELSPVRFLFPKGSIEVAYITKHEYPEYGSPPAGSAAAPLPQPAMRSLQGTSSIRNIIKKEGFPKQVFVFEPAVVEIKPDEYQEALGLFGDAGRFANAAGLGPKETLNLIADVLAIGGDEKLHDPEFWVDVIEKGIDGALSNLVRDEFGIPGGAMSGASPKDLLNAIANIQMLNGDPRDLDVFKDLSNMTPEDLIKKYLDVDPQTGDSLPSGGDSDTASGAAGGSSSGSTGSSGSSGTGGGMHDVYDTHGGGSSGGSGDSGTSGGSTGGGGTDTAGGTAESSGGGNAPAPGLVLTQEQFQAALETAGTGSGADAASSYARVETDQPGSEESGDSQDSDDDSDGTDDDTTDETDDSDSDDTSGNDDDTDTDTQGIPDPEKDTRPGKTWDQLSPEEQQMILLAGQALKNTLINPGDPETPLSSTTKTDMNISWRDLLGPYIYPTEGSSSGSSSGPTAPLGPGSAVFGPGHILGSLPDPPKL